MPGSAASHAKMWHQGNYQERTCRASYFPGDKVCAWCFVPEGNLAAGDCMLAQKIALETFGADLAPPNCSCRGSAVECRRCSAVTAIEPLSTSPAPAPREVHRNPPRLVSGEHLSLATGSGSGGFDLVRLLLGDARVGFTRVINFPSRRSVRPVVCPPPRQNPQHAPTSPRRCNFV
jgi:hypothetical protein